MNEADEGLPNELFDGLIYFEGAPNLAPDADDDDEPDFATQLAAFDLEDWSRA